MTLQVVGGRHQRHNATILGFPHSHTPVSWITQKSGNVLYYTHNNYPRKLIYTPHCFAAHKNAHIATHTHNMQQKSPHNTCITPVFLLLHEVISWILFTVSFTIRELPCSYFPLIGNMTSSRIIQLCNSCSRKLRFINYLCMVSLLLQLVPCSGHWHKYTEPDPLLH